MNDELEFYVYEHWRTDTNSCFYVGKGKKKRAWDFKSMRNRHYLFVVDKLLEKGLLVDVRIVKRFESEDEAFKFEIETIEKYGVKNLTNMTGGGDGLKNPSKETREKISKSQKERFNKPGARELASIRNRGRVTSEDTKKKLSLTSKGRKHSNETKSKMREAAKKRGISESTRIAQKLAVTGKKRKPFSEETRLKMSLSAQKRERIKKEMRA